MKRMLFALSFATALSFALTCPAELCAADLAAMTKTTVVRGSVIVGKDKAGRITLVALKTDAGTLLVPSRAIDNFAAYEGRTVKASCSVEGKSLVPLCVIGIVQAQKVFTARNVGR